MYGTSPPMWGCGLKWFMVFDNLFTMRVTPYVGVWIEIDEADIGSDARMSPPMWGCGLK